MILLHGRNQTQKHSFRRVLFWFFVALSATCCTFCLCIVFRRTATACLKARPDGDGEAVKTRWLPNSPWARCISGCGPLGVLGPCTEVRGGQRQTVTDLKEWDFSALCFVCGALRVQSRRTDVGGRGSGSRPRRPAVRCEAEIKDDQSLAGPLHYTQQAEVITHMGGADFMTSWWNNGDVDLFSSSLLQKQQRSS